MFDGDLYKISRRAIQKRWFVAICFLVLSGQVHRAPPFLCRFFMFNDCLVYGKKISATSCQYKGRINLGSAWIRILQDTKKIKNVFQVVDVEKTYTMYAETKEEKDVWVTKLQKTIDELMNKFPELKDTRSHAKTARPQTLFQPFTVNVDIFVVAGDDEYGLTFYLAITKVTQSKSKQSTNNLVFFQR